jgi:hypothetical protein
VNIQGLPRAARNGDRQDKAPAITRTSMGSVRHPDGFGIPRGGEAVMPAAAGPARSTGRDLLLEV